MPASRARPNSSSALWRLVDELAGLAAPLDAPKPAEFSAAAAEVRKLAHAALVKVEEIFCGCASTAPSPSSMTSPTSFRPPSARSRRPRSRADLRYAFREAADIFVQLFAPMMPHLAEEAWVRLGHNTLIANAPWPVADRSLIVEDTISLPVQVNGRKRADLVVARDADQRAIETAVLALEGVQRALEGKAVKKIIVVPQRIVNVVA